MDHPAQCDDGSVAGTSSSANGDVSHTETNGEIEVEDGEEREHNLVSVKSSVESDEDDVIDDNLDRAEILMKEIYCTIHKRTEEVDFEEIWQKKNQIVELKAAFLSSDMRVQAPYFPNNCPERFCFQIDHVQCHKIGDTTNRFAAFSVLVRKSKERIETEEKEKKERKRRIFSYGYGYFKAIKIKEEHIRSEPIKNTVIKTLKFIEKSNFKMYNSRKRIGFWQSFVVQINSEGEQMMTLEAQDDPESITTEEEFEELRHDLCQELQPFLDTLILIYTKRPDGAPVKEILFGDGYLTENVGRFAARIFGRSTVWVNPSAVNFMMKKVLEITNINDKWGVIMIGSFIGVDCLYIAEKCGQLILTNTSESVKQHIDYMAETNGITNMRFMSGHHIQQIIDGLAALKEYDNICAVMWCCDLNCQYTSHLRYNEKVKKILLGKEIKSLATVKSFLTLTHYNKNWPEEFVLTKSSTFDLTKFDYVTKTVYLFERLPLLHNDVSVNLGYSYATVEKVLHASINGVRLVVEKKKKKYKIGYKPRNKKKKPKKTSQGVYGPWVPVVYEEQVTGVENQISCDSYPETEHTDNSDSGSFHGYRHSRHSDSPDKRRCRAKSSDRKESLARKYERERSSHEYSRETTPHDYSRNLSRRAAKDRYKSSKEQERYRKDSNNSCRRKRSSSDSVEEARYDQ